MSTNNQMVRIYNSSPTKQPIRIRAIANAKDFVISEQQIAVGYNKYVDIEEKYVDQEQLKNLQSMGMLSFVRIDS